MLKADHLTLGFISRIRQSNSRDQESPIISLNAEKPVTIPNVCDNGSSLD